MFAFTKFECCARRTAGWRGLISLGLALAMGLVLVSTAPAQPVVSVTTLPTATPTDLALTLAFVSAPGISITSVTYTGALIGAGVYTPGDTYFAGEPPGLLLTSGGAVDIQPTLPGYFPFPGRSLGLPGDADLDALLSEFGFSTSTGDASSLVIEFNSASAGEISLLAAYGSQEYGFGMSPYPDVAAVFANGEQRLFKIDGNPVIAMSSDFTFVPPDFVLDAYPLAPDYFGVMGYLSATAQVVPGANTLKFAVADSTDDNYDCGLFVWGGAFTAGPVQDEFRRGDANADGTFNIADAISILSGLFSMGFLPCAQAADANDDESVNIADAVSVLSALFVAGAPLPPPPSACGADPTSGALTCDAFPPCP
ncbi:MAG: choice-of-anchor L domain-containing protein [Planctomycetota bacterium]